jgi:hypothetical protein
VVVPPLAGLIAFLAASAPTASVPVANAADPFGPLTPFLREAAPLPPPRAFEPDSLPVENHTEAERYSPNLYRQFGLSLGVAAYDNFDTTLRVSGEILGASLDLEDFLGVDDSDTIGRIDAHYSFNRRHRIDVSYYDIRRSGSRTIGQDIVIGDETIPAGTIDTFFNTKIIKLDYRYNFVADYRTVIGASIGAHTMLIDLGVSNEAFAVDSEFDAAAPLPLLGLHAAYALSEKWSLNGSVEFLQFDVDAYRGFINDTRLTIEHDTWEHFGWGIGYNGFTVDGDIDDGRLHADLEYGYQGLMLYLRCYF